MDVKRNIKQLFLEAQKDICDFLPTGDTFLQELVDGDALDGSDKQNLKDIRSRKERRQELIELLQEKPNNAYFTFMGILHEHESDLHGRLKKLEEKHGLTTSKRELKPDEPKKCKEPNPEPNADLKNIEDKQVSETDVSDIVEVILPNELPLVYTKLGLKEREVQRAKQGSASDDVKLKSRAVFLFWIQTNGSGATRQKVLDALEKNKYIDSLEELTRKWQEE